MRYGWVFPGVKDGKVNGINDSGMEIFKGSLYKSLARETCQNSLDAVHDKNKPVEVSYQVFDLPIDDFPDKDGFIKSLALIRDFYSIKPNAKVTDFLKRANQILSARAVKCLRISDSNTQGLIGSAEKVNRFSPWNNLVRSSGVSDVREVSGGSFGIGKSAPFACSELRSVFYSTSDVQGVTASQGVARLMSFEKRDRSIAVGEGYYYDMKSNAPIAELTTYDAGYMRKECGTDIFVFAFDANGEWKDDIIKSVIDSFMLAIIEGQLVVKVGNRAISRDNLGEYVDAYGPDMPEAKNYYEVFTSPETKIFQDTPLDGFDDVELRVLIKNGFHRKVAYFRSTGMKIHERGYVSSFIPFAAVLVLRGPKINKYFKDMESVAHDKWEPDRFDGSDSRNKANSNLKKLYKYIKDTICKFETDTNTDVIEAEGIGEYLPDDPNSERGQNSDNPQNHGEEKPRNKPIVDIVKRPFSTGGFSSKGNGAVIPDDVCFGGGDEDEEGEENGRAPMGRPNDTRGGAGSPAHLTGTEGGPFPLSKWEPVKPTYVRLFNTDFAKGEYSLTFMPEKAITIGCVELRISGEQGNYPALVKDARLIGDGASSLKYRESVIYVSDIPAGTKTKMAFSIDYLGYCTLEVYVREYKI